MPVMWMNSKDYALYVKETYERERILVDRLNLKSKPQ